MKRFSRQLPICIALYIHLQHQPRVGSIPYDDEVSFITAKNRIMHVKQSASYNRKRNAFVRSTFAVGSASTYEETSTQSCKTFYRLGTLRSSERLEPGHALKMHLKFRDLIKVK